jgi:maleylacetate reductase
MEDFRYVSYAQEIIFAPGSLSRLDEAVNGFGSRRFLLCANHSLQANGHVDAVQSALGEKLVLVFDHVEPHVQDVQVNEILALAIENNIDAVIGMGGGSPIGMAKAVAAALDEKRAGDQPFVPVIAIPTTYAGSEMTALSGVTHTDENPPRKVTISDPKIAPKLVIYDSELTLDLPKEMTASTGVNALAHCVEALYSKTRNPLSTAAATSGAHHIVNALLSCYHDGKDLAARTEMLLGAHLAGLSLASVSMGLHHGLCHVLGGTANIQHGIANSIILPHAIRFNADETAAQLIPVAAAMGVPVNRVNPMVVAEALVQKVFHLIGQMQLPQRLREAGVAESDLPQLAKLGFQNRTVQNNPKRITNADEIEKLLREAW